MEEVYIHLFHVILVGGLFFYVALIRNLPDFMYPTLIGLGVLLCGYHVYKSIFKKDAWVNYIHIFLVSPLLIYIGLYRAQTPRKVFEMLLLLAFASSGYHSFYIAKALYIQYRPKLELFYEAIMKKIFPKRSV